MINVIGTRRVIHGVTVMRLLTQPSLGAHHHGAWSRARHVNASAGPTGQQPNVTLPCACQRCGAYAPWHTRMQVMARPGRKVNIHAHLQALVHWCAHEKTKQAKIRILCPPLHRTRVGQQHAALISTQRGCLSAWWDCIPFFIFHFPIFQLVVLVSTT